MRVPLSVKPVDPSLRGTQTSLLLLGSSCSVSLLLLLEVAFLRTEHERGQLSNVARQVTCCVPQLYFLLPHYLSIVEYDGKIRQEQVITIFI